MNEYTICPACQRKNSVKEKYCLDCGQKLIEEKEDIKILENKLEIPKDKIILLDLNYTLISNSWKIRYDKLPQKIFNRQYEHELVNKIKDNYVILITASPYETSFDSLKHIGENIGQAGGISHKAVDVVEEAGKEKVHRQHNIGDRRIKISGQLAS